MSVLDFIAGFFSNSVLNSLNRSKRVNEVGNVVERLQAVKFANDGSELGQASDIFCNTVWQSVYLELPASKDEVEGLDPDFLVKMTKSCPPLGKAIKGFEPFREQIQNLIDGCHPWGSQMNGDKEFTKDIYWSAYKRKVDLHPEKSSLEVSAREIMLMIRKFS